MSAMIIRLSDYRPPPKPAPRTIVPFSPEWWADVTRSALRIQGLALLLWAQKMEGRND